MSRHRGAAERSAGRPSSSGLGAVVDPVRDQLDLDLAEAAAQGHGAAAGDVLAAIRPIPWIVVQTVAWLDHWHAALDGCRFDQRLDRVAGEVEPAGRLLTLWQTMQAGVKMGAISCS